MARKTARKGQRKTRDQAPSAERTGEDRYPADRYAENQRIYERENRRRQRNFEDFPRHSPYGD